MKLRNKLILSCAALAAVATTAVSTTYAWYTSNREVTASGITAQTASNGDDLLLISRTGVQNSWSANVDLSDINVNLTPVYKDATGAFKLMTANPEGSDDDITDGTEVFSAATGGYISFDLYFKSGNATDLTVQFKTFKLKNVTGITSTQTTKVLPTKSALTSNVGTSGQSGFIDNGLGAVGASYSVDILRAMTMEISEGNTLEAVTGKTPAAPATTASTYYQFNGLASGDNVGTGYNAHKYYNAILGTQITDDADGSVEYRTSAETTPSTREELYGSSAKVNAETSACTSWAFTNSTGSGTAGTAGTDDTGVSILKVHFDIYLDGWDFACFDACQGQNITLDMVFETATV